MAYRRRNATVIWSQFVGGILVLKEERNRKQSELYGDLTSGPGVTGWKGDILVLLTSPIFNSSLPWLPQLSITCRRP